MVGTRDENKKDKTCENCTKLQLEMWDLAYGNLKCQHYASKKILILEDLLKEANLLIHHAVLMGSLREEPTYTKAQTFIKDVQKELVDRNLTKKAKF